MRGVAGGKTHRARLTGRRARESGTGISARRDGTQQADQDRQHQETPRNNASLPIGTSTKWGLNGRAARQGYGAAALAQRIPLRTAGLEGHCQALADTVTDSGCWKKSISD